MAVPDSLSLPFFHKSHKPAFGAPVEIGGNFIAVNRLARE